MAGITTAFEFMEGGRTYACRVEESSRVLGEVWWWFDVKGDRSRYAAFRVDAQDTERSVRERIVTWYEDRAERRGWIDSRHGRPTNSGDVAAPGAT